MTMIIATTLDKPKCNNEPSDCQFTDGVVHQSVVAWVLLFTYWLVLCVAVFGLWLLALNFGSELELPPTPPEIISTSTTTPYVNPYYYAHRHDSSQERQLPTREFRAYIAATHRYANYTLDPRLYLVLPCGTALLAAGTIMLGGVFSRKLFSTTAGLHTSAVLWVLVLVIMILYNANAVNFYSENTLLASGWVVGVHASLLLLLSLQLVMTIWELRRQKTGWPTLVPGQIFTLGAMLIAGRMTLSVYFTLNFYNSWMIFGVQDFSTNLDFWPSSVLRFPEQYVLPCATACAYGGTVVIQDLFSHFMGPVNNVLRACTATVCALLYISIAVITSPLFVKIIIGSFVRPTLMVLAILTSILSVLQAILCFVIPDVLKETPEVFRVMVSRLQSSARFASERGFRPSSITLANVEDAVDTGKNIVNEDITCNFFLLLVQVQACVAAVLAVSGDWSNLYITWGTVVMLCGDAAVLTRILPSFLVQLAAFTRIKAARFLQVTCLLLECALLLVGSVATFCMDTSVGHTAAAVVNLILGFCLLNKVTFKKVVGSDGGGSSTRNVSTTTTSSTSITNTSNNSILTSRETEGSENIGKEEKPLTEAGPAEADQHEAIENTKIVS
ncbi:uncharacterized protein [Cherax quadricarinatus]|uniref:uncharacterized protein isoform X2 n=1 Tax=Cherax quadricarinatus TaxID=27406 RepID=UPI00387ECAF4